ncbi:hypothetical protein ACFC3F_12895 [Microbacterium sp. NPDC055910]|uniref:hypothetical protein n=1 Tax=Microbacterium sp. NPDC055910 TaxID=3345659 RepID=UPI0035D89582
MTDADARPPRPLTPAVEPPSPDVELAEDAVPLPGAHRGGFSRLPTAPVETTTEWHPAEPGASAEWLLPPPPASRGVAAWALGFAIAGLIGSLLVGWAFPVGLVGVIVGIVALRNPVENRTAAVWAVVLGAVSILYSAGWLLWAAGELNLFG